MATNEKRNPAVDAEASEADRLREENTELRKQLAEAQANQKPVANTRPKPVEPSFGLSEGERADLELLQARRDAGEKVEVKVTSPFTGKHRAQPDQE